MNFSALFVRRPVATTVLTFGAALAGIVAFFLLPVSLLPQVDLPTIIVEAWLAGASPEIMASSVAAPLERHLSQVADVSEMTSESYRGYTRVTLQFGLDRNIDGAARDVQAAINAARADLPVNLRSTPSYHKVNPAGPPVLVLALTSPTRSPGQLYDAAATVLQQKLSQIEGIGQVTIGGGSLPAVRVELNPHALFRYAIGLEDVRAALNAANAHSPKGAIEDGAQRWQVYTNDQARDAAAYRSLVIAFRDGGPVRLSDVAEVVDSVEDLRNRGIADGRRAVLVVLYRQPGANIIDTVDRIKALLPYLRASIPADIDITPMSDRTLTIRASLHEIERTLLLAAALVVAVVFLFLRDGRAALISSVAVPVSLATSFAGMYLLGFSLDNLSLMALTIATGFVLDDVIVVLENVMRHVEDGMTPVNAAIEGAREVGLTVLSMSVSLIAVFLPILLMGGLVGRLFREFALTVSMAVAASLVVSLTTTPMLCAYLIKRRAVGRRGERRPLGILGASGRLLDAMRAFYGRSLGWALDHSSLIVLSLLGTLCLSLYLFVVVPKGLVPQQDTGRLTGWIQADQSSSFQLMRDKLDRFIAILDHDPAVESAAGYTWGYVFVTLKPLSERDLAADEVIERLRKALGEVPGATLYLQSAQDIAVGGRQSNAQFQYTLLGDDLAALRRWTPVIVAALQKEPALADVNADQQDDGLESDLVIDRGTAARFGLSVSQIDNTLYDAFGQRQVSTIYTARNQYHVIMEVAPQYWQSPQTLNEIYVSTAGGPVSGTRASNAVAGTTTAPSAPLAEKSAAAIAADVARNLAANQLGATGRYLASSGAPVSNSGRDHGAAGRRHPLRDRQDAGRGLSPRPLRRHHHLLQPAARRSVERRRFGDPARDGGSACPRRHPWQLRGHGARLRAVALRRAAPRARRDPHRLYRPRHSLRERDPSRHHPLDLALGRAWRGAGAAGAPHRLQRRRADRRHPADRHRDEERDHDDRRRARHRAAPRDQLARRDLRDLPAALSSHPDDHRRGIAGGAPAGAWSRRGRRAAPAARHRHRRRPHREPAAHAL